MTDWIEIGILDDIPVLGARVVKTDDGDIAVFRTGDDHLFAVDDCCPHKGGPLSQGIVFGDKVACPLHNWKIALDTGAAAAPDEGHVACYPVRLEGDKVMLSLSKSAANKKCA
ncbi:MAG: nitrite reductase small subunit NirD [Alphaproteobacteria bacterium]